MDEIREILQAIAQSTQATTSAGAAVKKAVRTTTAGWSKLITKPNLFDDRPQEEEEKRSESGNGYLRSICAQLMRLT